MGESPKLPDKQNAFPFAIRPIGGFSYVIMPLTLQEAATTLDATLRSLKGRRVVVLGHMRPDGDCIGSQTALCRILLGFIPRCQDSRSAVGQTQNISETRGTVKNDRIVRRSACGDRCCVWACSNRWCSVHYSLKTPRI